eukprot:14898729-Alexandrium_andersonii.AAC.1
MLRAWQSEAGQAPARSMCLKSTAALRAPRSPMVARSRCAHPSAPAAVGGERRSAARGSNRNSAASCLGPSVHKSQTPSKGGIRLFASGL